LARPQKSNEIKLLTPALRLDALRLREIVSTKQWSEIFEALRLEALRLSRVS
jgi:RNA polymerase-interacting CarD/CdnL/TRCF family regulator